jgi:hypothetical protein
MMKKLYITGFLIAMILCISCGRNRLKTDEKKLVNQILTEEEQLAQQEAKRVEREKQLADSIAKLPKGIRFMENRSVDPNNPPTIIDFTAELPFREMKMSDLFKKITYIKLSIPDDSLYFSPGRGGNVNFTNDNLIVNNNLGVHRFSRDGKYIEPIAKSNLETRKIEKKAFPGYFEKETYRGVWGNHVSVAGNRIFYKFSDYPDEKVSLIDYELKSGEQTVDFTGGKESAGDESFTKGKIITSGKEAMRSGTPGLSSTYIYGISSNFYAGVNSHLDATRNGFMLATFNLTGDTLCKFTQFDKLETPITSSVIRSVSSILKWHYKGIFTFMKTFNDTIFRLIPPNRIVPVFVFKFGINKITDEEWYNFSKKLDGKYIPESIIENEKFIFVRATYFITNESREKRYVLYDKRNKKLTLLTLNNELKNKMYNAPTKIYKWMAGLENDLDNGFPFWPDFVTPEGNAGITLKPSTLRDMVHKPGFDLKLEKNMKLKLLTESLGSDNNEMIIMIAE